MKEYSLLQHVVVKLLPLILCAITLTIIFSCNPSREFLNHDLQEQMSKKRVVQHAEDKEEFDITTVKPKVNKYKVYYWFKSGEIHNSVGAYEGMLIDNSYTKFNLDEDLQEKGLFKKGLKIGEWRTWYPNGKLHYLSNYVNGRQQGVFIEYDTIGKEILHGRFKNNLKHGKWTYINDNKTLYFKKGIDVTSDSIRRNMPFYKRWFPKKNDSLKAIKKRKSKNIETTKKSKTKQSSNKNRNKKGSSAKTKSDSTTVKKEGFLKRFFNNIFKKKDKKTKNDKS